MDATRRYLTPTEFAKMAALSVSTLWRRIKDGTIPSYQPAGKGTRRLIPVDAIELPVPIHSSAAAPDSAVDTSPQSSRRGRKPLWLKET